MSQPSHPLLSTVGTKSLMAVTGLALVLFVLGHMLGNLQIYLGPDALNAYAHKLQGLGPLLWVVRAGLLSILVVHVACALRVWSLDRAARPVPYKSARPQVTGVCARSMVLTGLVIAAFVVYHLMHFTLGATNPDHFALKTADGHRDVYAMVVSGFSLWPVSLAYLVAQACLALHLAHGASSAFQSLGVTHPRLAFLKGGFGKAVAALVFLGNASIPLSVLAGIVHLPAGAR
jgi:succinate dehydrogenase / fumarate reductase cytochrome b subunit